MLLFIIVVSVFALSAVAAFARRRTLSSPPWPRTAVGRGHGSAYGSGLYTGGFGFSAGGAAGGGDCGGGGGGDC